MSAPTEEPVLTDDTPFKSDSEFEEACTIVIEHDYENNSELLSIAANAHFTFDPKNPNVRDTFDFAFKLGIASSGKEVWSYEVPDGSYSSCFYFFGTKEEIIQRLLDTMKEHS